jgi:hypothetical protein
MAQVCVVIPVHSEAPTKLELLSFAQCLNVLHKHPIYIIAPLGLNLDAYRRVNGQFTVKYIDPVWLSSYQKYNNLKCSFYFYNLFRDYNYLLTYELDAYVFQDDLLSWCDKGYDYIGAPWIKSYSQPKNRLEFNGVGNSGFSLRKVKSCLNVLNELSYLEELEQYQFLNLKGLLPRLPKIIGKLIRKRNNSSFFERNFVGHEDGFWCIYAKQRLNNFKSYPYLQLFFSKLVVNNYLIADEEEAIKFSFEECPQILFKINNNSLPFGCHAWAKYEPDFWKPYILL